MRSVAGFFIVSVLCLFFSSTPLFAQLNLHRGTVDLYGNGTGTFWLPAARAVVFAGTLPNFTNLVTANSGEPSVQSGFGGGAAVSLTRLFWAYGDYGYIMENREVASIPSEVLQDANTHYSKWDSGIQFSYPTVHKVAPYLLAGLGMLHESFFATNVFGPAVANPGIRFDSISRNHTLIHFGGGVRFFLGNHWGIRAGVDGFYMPQAVQEALPVVSIGFTSPLEARHGFEQVSGGFFFQFR